MNFRELREYYIIQKSSLFDKYYYLTEYPDVRRADVDPIKHFIKFGWKQGRNPNRLFRTNAYMMENHEYDFSKTNPFVHYINNYDSKTSPNQHNDIKPLSNIIQNNNTAVTTNRIDYCSLYRTITPIETSEIVDIVICVGSNSNNIKACISSIKKYTKPNSYKIHVVVHQDDLQNLEDLLSSDIEIHTHDMVLFNFARANNIVLKTSQNDVILLNDDTEVTELWMEKLKTASKGVALTGAHTGKLCAGNPDMWEAGPTMITNYAINMFCAYIPKRVLKIVGLLNEEYAYYGGEDTDYSGRARQNGIPLVISDAFVFHKNNQSFKDSKELLLEETFKLLYENYKIVPPLDLSHITPKVSIIMATHNRAHLIMSTLHSIEEIEYNNFEIIIVDDSSTDQTAEVLLEYQKTHHNFKYIRLPQNSGSTIARTIGLNASDGQFILFTDDDDTVLQNRIISPLNSLLNNSTLDVVYCGYNTISDNGYIVPNYCKPFNVESYLELEFNIGIGILLGRRKAFIDVPFLTIYDNASDYDWVFRLIRRGFTIDLCPEIVMNYNRTGSPDQHLSGNKKSNKVHQEIKKRELLLRNLKRTA